MMKRCLSMWLAVAMLLFMAVPCFASSVSKDGYWNGIRLCGRVKVVDAFPDIKVQVVTAFPDLKVKVVDAFPNDIGKSSRLSRGMFLRLVVAFEEEESVAAAFAKKMEKIENTTNPGSSYVSIAGYFCYSHGERNSDYDNFVCENEHLYGDLDTDNEDVRSFRKFYAMITGSEFIPSNMYTKDSWR